MKKSLPILVSVVLSVVLVAIVCFSQNNVGKVITEQGVSAQNDIVTVANVSKQDEGLKVLEARFLNMLNHNFVYGEDFDSLDAIVNNSVIALLDLRDSEDESYIAQNFVADYVFNMYGIEIEDFSLVNAHLPQKEGYVYILPRGYSVYTHKMASVSVNEDGSYTVVTKVTSHSHDGTRETEFCKTLFVQNSASQFGYSIISSDIGGALATM